VEVATVSSEAHDGSRRQDVTERQAADAQLLATSSFAQDATLGSALFGAQFVSASKQEKATLSFKSKLGAMTLFVHQQTLSVGVFTRHRAP